MKKAAYLIVLTMFIYGSATSQSNVNYEKIINDFVIDLDGSDSFPNGINTFIKKPKNDTIALQLGFETAQCDQESTGNWSLLFAKDVTLDNKQYRAVLYEHKNIMHIALYREEKEDVYYFRIFCSLRMIPPSDQ
jgi:hypothetical protein